MVKPGEASLSISNLPGSLVTGDYHFLIQPGYQNSGAGHWQTIWELLYPGKFTRVEQESWDQPEKNNWINTLNRYIQRSTEPLIIVAHSLGCIAVAHWAWHFQSPNIVGALLVAPADADRSFNQVIKAFGPVPVNRLPFPSVVVASTDDPYAATVRQAYYAAGWGSKFISIGDRGHINAASGLGEWQEGLDILSGQLIGKLIEINKYG
ncbi:MAG: alpha/beta hydrolase [Ferruginibacter sp.]